MAVAFHILYSIFRMSVARKIFSNTVWQVAGKVVVAVLGIVSIKFITNYLTRSEYGEYTTIYDYTALFAIIADFGLFTIALREMAHDEKSTEKIIGNVLSIRTTLAVFALGIGILAAYLIPAYQRKRNPFWRCDCFRRNNYNACRRNNFVRAPASFKNALGINRAFRREICNGRLHHGRYSLYISE